MLLEKNSECTVEIESLSSEAQGIGRVDGMAVFVPFALPGETVRAKIIKREKKYAIAKVVDYIEISERRINAPCGVYMRCGGCNLQHMNYETQLEFKRRQIVDALKRIGGIENADELTQPCTGMDEPWRYRNKAAFPASNENAFSLGLYASRSHRVIATSECLIQDEQSVQAMQIVESWARKHKITAYDEISSKGLIRHVYLRKSTLGEMMLVLVCNSAKGNTIPEIDALLSSLQESLPCLKSVIINQNNMPNNVILGKKSSLVYGKPTIKETICGFNFDISAETFLQVNPVQMEKLYLKALDAANLNKNDIVIDAYCGMGSMSLLFAKKAAKVIGIEIVERAIKDAKINAANNGVENVDFICAAAEKQLPKTLSGKTKVSCLLLDPPRKGCAPELIDAVISAKIPKIIYVSCNPATLARDLSLLCKASYSVNSVDAIDMFPQTSHVETVVLMSRVEK